MQEEHVGSGSIIGKENLKEYFNYVSKSKDIEDNVIAECAPDYETAVACLVYLLEAKFVNLHPVMQYMFLNLHNIDDVEKKIFILKTMTRGLGDVSIQANKVFARYNMLGSDVDVVGTLDKFNGVEPDAEEGIKVSVPSKITGLHEAHDKNFDWIVPENLFDENSTPRRDEQGTSAHRFDRIHVLAERLSEFDLDTSLENT